MTSPPTGGGTIKVPVFGSQKKTTVYVVGGVVVVFLGVSFYRARSNKPAISTDPGDNAINPATGFPYGSAEDAQATAANSAYQNPVDYGGGGGPPANTPTAPGVGGGYTSNAQWQQAAVAYLSETVGHSAPLVSAALSKYLHGEGVVPTEKTLVLEAIAAEGQPPQGGPNGFPPSIHEAAAGPKTKLAAPRLKVAAKRKGHATLAWTAVPNAYEYHVHYGGRTVHVTRSLTQEVHTNGAYDVYSIPAPSGSRFTPSGPSNIVKVSGI